MTLPQMPAHTLLHAVLLKRPHGEVTDTYLGLLYPTEEFKVYG